MPFRRGILLLLISLVINLTNSLFTDKKTYWIPSQGVYLEQSTTVLTSQGYLMIPYTFHTPDPLYEARKTQNCSVDVQIQEILFKLKEHLERRVPPLYINHCNPKANTNYHKRNKRFLGVGAAILGAVTGSIWNRISITSLQKSMADLTQHVNKNHMYIKHIAKTTISIMNEENRMIHVVSTMHNLISDLFKNVSCDLVKTMNIEHLMMQYNFFGPHDFTTALHSGLENKISPELLPPQELERLPEIIDDLKTNPLIKNPELFYKHALFQLNGVCVSEFLISGLIIVPQISVSDSGLGYLVYASPIEGRIQLMQLRLPSFVVISEENERVYQITQSSCTHSAGVKICPKYQQMAKSCRCLENVLFRNTSASCNWEKPTDQFHATFFETESSVIVTPYAKKVQLIRVGSGRHIQLENKTGNRPYKLTKKDADAVLIDDQYISLVTNQLDYEETLINVSNLDSNLLNTVNARLSETHPLINNLLTNASRNEVDDLLHTSDTENSSTTYLNYVVISSLVCNIIIGLILILVCLRYKGIFRTRRVATRRAKSLSLMEDLDELKQDEIPIHQIKGKQDYIDARSHRKIGQSSKKALKRDNKPLHQTLSGKSLVVDESTDFVITE